MSRIERRLRHSSLARPALFDPEQVRLEGAHRARTARKIRVGLRRSATVLLTTPRWSQPRVFLEDLALELAVGEPGIGCRTVSFRAARGRPEAEGWQIALGVFAQLGQPRWVHSAPLAVADRRGFRVRLAQILGQTEETLRAPVALLAHDVDSLPVQVLEDIGEVWCGHVLAAGPERRSLLLLSGGAAARSGIPGAVHLDLADYGEEEAEEALRSRGGPFPSRALRSLARFTGGVPGLVEAFADRLAEGRTPVLNPDALLGELGVLADELRGAVDIACADGRLAERLQRLLPGEPLPADPELDEPLLDAGLLRRHQLAGLTRVELRCPAIAALVA